MAWTGKKYKWRKPGGFLYMRFYTHVTVISSLTCSTGYHGDVPWSEVSQPLSRVHFSQLVKISGASGHKFTWTMNLIGFCLPSVPLATTLVSNPALLSSMSPSDSLSLTADQWNHTSHSEKTSSIFNLQGRLVKTAGAGGLFVSFNFLSFSFSFLQTKLPNRNHRRRVRDGG